MRIPQNRNRHSLGSIYRAPLILAAISLFGLIAALMVDGLIDLLWVIAIAAPLFALTWAAIRNR